MLNTISRDARLSKWNLSVPRALRTRLCTGKFEGLSLSVVRNPKSLLQHRLECSVDNSGPSRREFSPSFGTGDWRVWKPAIHPQHWLPRRIWSDPEISGVDCIAHNCQEFGGYGTGGPYFTWCMPKNWWRHGIGLDWLESALIVGNSIVGFTNLRSRLAIYCAHCAERPLAEFFVRWVK